ncbi:MAG: VTT domain-containing protein [Paracoccaceae bacterium]|nr:VTT domain-containing protein [Paracoccaceae bacterium]
MSLVAFWESIIFPLPPDLILIPMSLARRDRALVFAGLATIFSVFGGIIGYLLGSLFWTEIGKPLTASLGYSEVYTSFEILFERYGILIVIIGALTPFPFKVIAILSGLMGYSFTSFLIAAFFSRGLRFYIIAGIIFIWGSKIDSLLKNYLGLVFIAFTSILIGAYVFFN